MYIEVLNKIVYVVEILIEGNEVEMGEIIKVLVGQLLGLLAFFAFPALRYLFLKSFSKRKGNPQVWYFPDIGFRIVIRNFSSKKSLIDIKYRALVRSIIPASSPENSPTYLDIIFHSHSDFFLLPGIDQVLFAFKLEGLDKESLFLINSDLKGEERTRVLFSDFDTLICDYQANIVNGFNFDIRINKRVIIPKNKLIECFKKQNNIKINTKFNIAKVINIG